jgi:hypothetical protein
MPTETIECPLCLGAGKLKRTEILDRLGVKDFARVAELSAQEAFRLLLSKHQKDEQSGWARFEAELAKRTAELAQTARFSGQRWELHDQEHLFWSVAIQCTSR